MWEQAQQQAYDRGITIFSPDGRLYQVEYAREAVKRGTASLGVRTAEGVVLAADIRSRSALMEARSIEKLHKVDHHVGIASAGHVADGRRLIDFARRDAQVNRLRYDEPIDVETLAKHLSDVVQQYTQLGGTRPFGVALLIGGVTDGKRQLYELDPSGAITEWRAAAIGANRDQIQDHLEGHYADELTLDEGVDLALAALAAGREEPLDAEGVNVAVVSATDGRYRTLEPEEVEEHLPDIPDGDAAAADGDGPDDEEASDEDEPDE